MTTAHREAGLSLIEIVMAAAVLSLVMLGVLAAVNGSFMADGVAANATRAQAIARQAMEECLAVPYENLLALDGNQAAVEGFTVTISVVQSSVDTRLVEVVVDKPGTLGSLTRLLTLRASR